MPLADDLVDAGVVSALVAAVHRAEPSARLRTLTATTAVLPLLRLRERGRLVRDALMKDLPGSYEYFAATVRAARELSPSFTGWMIWPVTTAVAVKAIEDGSVAALDDALELLAAFTPLLTSEYALRLLLRNDVHATLERVQSWTGHFDEDVRRLASEGTRPLLPWADRVPVLLAEPHKALPVLHALYRDPSEYVRRSVAAHLQDLSKRVPDLAVAVGAQWIASPGRSPEDTARLVVCGLRPLIRRQHPGALLLLDLPVAADL